MRYHGNIGRLIVSVQAMLGENKKQMWENLQRNNCQRAKSLSKPSRIVKILRNKSHSNCLLSQHFLICQVLCKHFTMLAFNSTVILRDRFCHPTLQMRLLILCKVKILVQGHIASKSQFRNSKDSIQVLLIPKFNHWPFLFVWCTSPSWIKGRKPSWLPVTN